jgi:hypothetical protein
VGVVIIRLHEKGIPHHLHPNILRRFPAVVEVISDYQEFRVSVRRENFSPSATPESGPEFAGWLRSKGLSDREFSEMACMPVIDISYALHHWRLPITIRRFFEEINADAEHAQVDSGTD